MYKVQSTKINNSRKSSFDGPWASTISGAVQGFTAKARKLGVPEVFQVSLLEEADEKTGAGRESGPRGKYYNVAHPTELALVLGLLGFERKSPLQWASDQIALNLFKVGWRHECY